ncbi:nickel/cobalt efflux transporter [Undibacterium sp. SXout7W]|uniref:nickel/cobalt efflux transporter n=1 Tax=Undibacterium sp. SXout7W TaxID=3413049 RepID=UPI003BF45608
MIEFSQLLQQGAANAWLFIPSAILLGALHGLEPGHSKTMMAAFIIAVRGTVTQAVLLGLAATLSHTAIVWIIALSGLYFGQQWNAEESEPYFQLISAAMIIAVAVWMMWRTWRDQHAHQHSHPHSHDHSHDDARQIDTGHGMIYISIMEDGVPPRFHLSQSTTASQRWTENQISALTIRADGSTQTFHFKKHGDLLESLQEIPEPHEFTLRIITSHGDHQHSYELMYSEDDHSHHDQHHHHDHGLDINNGEYQDAHARAHAEDIRRRFSTRDVTTGQIIMFGLTGGLIPCPASITVLLLCLQLKKVALGASLVLCFSIGLALTMVMSGVIAALSVRHLSTRWSGFGLIAQRAPYFSGALIMLVGVYVAYQGYSGILHHA